MACPSSIITAACAARPIDVIRGELTGLPIPAHAEIAIEGEVPPPQEQMQMEGPFGEWPGYYAHGAAKEPVIRVKRVYYRNDPILCGAPPLKPPYVTFGVPIGAAAIWNYLEKADVPDIKGVWCAIGSSAAAGGAPFIIVSVKQRYHGHAQQAGSPRWPHAAATIMAASSSSSMTISIRPI